MWSGQLHDPNFVGKVLKHLESSKDRYGTAARMKGMLTVAQEVRTILLSLTLLFIIVRSFKRPSISLPAGSPAISIVQLHLWMSWRQSFHHSLRSLVFSYRSHDLLDLHSLMLVIAYLVLMLAQVP